MGIKFKTLCRKNEPCIRSVLQVGMGGGGECNGVRGGVGPGGVGFGVRVRGLSILTEAKQNGTVHRSGGVSLMGEKKNYFDRFF